MAAATDDLLTMFVGRYVPQELGTDLPGLVPADLDPPALDLTFEQEFFAGGYLGGFDALAGNVHCSFTNVAVLDRLVANKRSHETHSLARPCAWVSRISPHNRIEVSAKPAGYRWCDVCFPARADG